MSDTNTNQANQPGANQPGDLPLTAAEQQFANAAPNEGAATGQSAGQVLTQFGQKLREQTIAVRLRRSKWGISKKLGKDQVETAAEQFHAEASRLSASKKLIDSKEYKYRACNKTIAEAVEYWRDVTVPYPEDGVRLLRQNKLDAFVSKMVELRAKLRQQVSELQDEYQDMIARSRAELGELFNWQDYPVEITDLFGLDWEFPPTKPDELLKQLNPELYAAEHARIQARFDEAVRLAEEAFTTEFAKCVSHLTESLGLGEDGKPRVIRTSSVSNLVDFFGRFKELNVGSNAELERLVDDAQRLIAGDPDEVAKNLRKDATQRAFLQSSFADLATRLDSHITVQPGRKLTLFADPELLAEQPVSEQPSSEQSSSEQPSSEPVLAEAGAA